MASSNPFNAPPFADKGDANADSLSLAVGQALSTWEHAEGSFAHLFGTIIRPTRNSYAARRAYGSIATARGRRDMLQAVAAVFFRNFPSTSAEKDMRALLIQYNDAGARRNDLAHGIVGRGKNKTGKASGYFIMPSVWNSNKRGLDSDIKYRYSTKEIGHFRDLFSVLSGRAISVADAIDAIFQSSPQKLRERW